MKYVRIKNKGEIQPEALHLVGASSKRNQEGKIGQFGSGNKFAMAYLIRNDYGLKVFSGTNEIVITTTEKSFREQNFKIVNINGEQTSITTEMGKDWQFWQAIREIYSNALDEGDASIDFVQNIEPKENETHFYLDVKKDVIEFMMNFDNYFATNKKVLFECKEGRILEKTGTKANIYRRGIKCYNTDASSIFDYDFNDINVGENRLVEYYWNVDEKIWKILFQCNNKELIMKLLHDLNNRDLMEANPCTSASIYDSGMSEEFKECLRSNHICPKGYAGMLKPDEVMNHIIIPTEIFMAIRGNLLDDNVGDKFKTGRMGCVYRYIDGNELQSQILKQAINFLKECNLDIPYEIKISIFDEKNVMGYADIRNKTIIISDICLEKGVNEVVNTLIEEFIHIKYNVKDETRGFQTAIITEFISYMKKVNSFAI